MMIKFNEDDVKNFYRFFRHKESTEIRVFDKVKFPKGKSEFVTNENDFVKRCRYYCEEEQVSVYIGARDRSARGDKNVTSSSFVFFEIDEHGVNKTEERDKIIKFLEDNNITITMQGMSGGGWHFYIMHNLASFKNSETALLYKEQSLTSFKKVMQGQGFDIDGAVFNLERVTRVLGTYNYKRDKISNIDFINKSCNVVNNTNALKELLKTYKEMPIIKENNNIDNNLDDDPFINEIKKKWVEGDRQELSMSLSGYLRKNKRLGLNSCLNIVKNIATDCNDEEISQRLNAVRSTFSKDEKDIKGITGLIEKEIKPVENLSSKIGDAFNKKDLAKRIIDVQPCYYDKYRIWWLWNSEKYKWQKVDEVDILNVVDERAAINTINSKEKNEMIEALKQVSRLHKPIEIKKTWIQFKDKIFDIENGETFEASSKYFMTNPIEWELNGDKETPVMDRIFEEWVGKDNVKTLYEIIAYCLIPDYPIHRIFCFIGGGMNGKSCFLNLLRKFIGGDNCCSTELDTLLQSRFEVSRLHKKLVCQMGETNFSEMSKTSTLKKLSGGDLIGFEYKRKDPFEDVNYAKIIIATNNLPTTTDKTIGFYRRWMIIDFPNQFSEKKDILADIPLNEYNALTLKCCGILEKLLIKREFTNEGSIEDRIKNYEDKSNPLEKFMREFTEEDFDGVIWKNDFAKKLNEWCRQNRFREISDVSIGSKMKQLNIDQKLKYLPWDINKKGRGWVGIKWKNSEVFE